MTGIISGAASVFPSAMLAAVVGAGSGEGVSPWDILLQHLIAAIVFSFIGILVFAGGVWLFVKLSPFSVRKEIEEDQNTALGVIMGSVLLGISIIIAAAILG